MEGKASMMYERKNEIGFKLEWLCLAVIIAVIVLM